MRKREGKKLTWFSCVQQVREQNAMKNNSSDYCWFDRFFGHSNQVIAFHRHSIILIVYNFNQMRSNEISNANRNEIVLTMKNWPSNNNIKHVQINEQLIIHGLTQNTKNIGIYTEYLLLAVRYFYPMKQHNELD